VTGGDKTERQGAKAHEIRRVLRLADTAWDRTKRQLHNQEMGGPRRAGRCGLLPCAVGGDDGCVLRETRNGSHSFQRECDVRIPTESVGPQMARALLNVVVVAICAVVLWDHALVNLSDDLIRLVVLVVAAIHAGSVEWCLLLAAADQGTQVCDGEHQEYADTFQSAWWWPLRSVRPTWFPSFRSANSASPHDVSAPFPNC
jgi:hypothetical protein